MKAIDISHLSKRFGGVQAVGDISLSVDKGERRAIIGPNGAGKTTFLNLIGGLYPADSGRISVFGKDIASLPDYDRIWFGISRTFQLTSVFMELPVMDNVLLAVQAIKRYRFGIFRTQRSHRDLQEEARALLNRWGFWEKRNIAVRELSYGEQRKVELMMGLASNPRILLLDEPTCGLTAEESGQFADLICAIGNETTLLIVEHDMDIVFRIASRITVLYHGNVLTEGTPREIGSDPRVREVYLGSKDPSPSEPLRKTGAPIQES